MKRIASLLFLGVLLSACGGGGGGDAPALQPAAAGPASTPTAAVDTLSFGMSATGTAKAAGDLTLTFFDPSAPTLTRLAVAQKAQEIATPSAFQAASNATVAITRGGPLNFFVKDGQVYQVNTRRDQTTAATRISSLTDGCFTVQTYPVNAAATDVWVQIETAKRADGSCAMEAIGASPVYVRSGASTGTPAVTLPPGSSIVHVQRDAALNVVSFLVFESLYQRVALYDANFVPYGLLPVVVNATPTWLGVDPASAQAGYLAMEGQLRRIDWSQGKTTSLFSSTYTFTQTPGYQASISTPDAIYFQDGQTILKIGATSTPTPIGNALGSGDIQSLWATPTRIVAVKASSVSSLPKSGSGPAVALPAAIADAFLGVNGEKVMYLVDPAGTQNDALRQVLADGSGDTLLAARAQFLTYTMELRTANIDDAYTFDSDTHSVVYCVPQTGAADCRGSVVREYLPADGRDIRLGTLGAAASAHTLFGPASGPTNRAERWGVFHISTNLAQDFYSFSTGVSDTLQRGSAFIQ